MPNSCLTALMVISKTACGGRGNDTLAGGVNDDVLIGNDTLVGGPDNDFICGGNGDDSVRGGDDNDVAYGQAGEDGEQQIKTQDVVPRRLNFSLENNLVTSRNRIWNFLSIVPRLD